MIRPKVPAADVARRIELRWVRENGAKVNIKKIETKSARKIRRVSRLGWMETDRASVNDVLGGKS
jgi:hypothetical protein